MKWHRNPTETKARMNYEHFHGVESEELLQDEIDWPPSADLQNRFGNVKSNLGDLTQLGELICICYEDKETLQDVIIDFHPPYPLLCSDYAPEKREQLIITGGNYVLRDIPQVLGSLVYIEYRTVKSFDDLEPTIYKHRFSGGTEEHYPVVCCNEDGTQIWIMRDKSKFYIDRTKTISRGIIG